MRPMNRLARRAQATLRRKPQPSWLAPLRRVGLMMGVMFVIGLLADLAWRSAPVQAAVASARTSVLGAAEREGLVVGEVLAEGATNTDRRALLRMLAQYRDQNILTVDIGEIRDRTRSPALGAGRHRGTGVATTRSGSGSSSTSPPPAGTMAAGRCW